MRTSGEDLRRYSAAHVPGAAAGERARRGVVVAAAQSPASPRLVGEAPPPSSVLSLWYRRRLRIIRCCRRTRLGRPRPAPPSGFARFPSVMAGSVRWSSAASSTSGCSSTKTRCGPGGRTIRSIRTRKTRSRSEAPDRRAQVPGGGEARRSESDVEAARADAVRDGRRSRTDVSTVDRSRTTGAISIWRRPRLTCRSPAAV